MPPTLAACRSWNSIYIPRTSKIAFGYTGKRMGLDKQSDSHLFYIQFQCGFFNRQLWRARRREKRIRTKWKLVKLGKHQQRYFSTVSLSHQTRSNGLRWWELVLSGRGGWGCEFVLRTSYEFSHHTHHQPALAGFGVSDREFIHGAGWPVNEFMRAAAGSSRAKPTE